MESTDKNKSQWWKFKRWCYLYHQELALGMMIILIIIGIWFNPFEDIGEEIHQQYGGRIGAALKGIKSVAKSTGFKDQIAKKGTDPSMISKEGPNIKLDDIKNFSTRSQQKSAGLMGSSASSITEGAGAASNYLLDTFRNNASLIYEVFYQIAFIVIILLIVFPTIGFFIIAIICFIILRDKLAYLKSL